jgi:predicted lipoprotein with Yx(FWY)xxD motif
MRMTVVRRLLITGVAVLAVGGLLAACGDDDNKTEAGSGGGSTTAATSSESSTTAPAADLTVTVKEDPKLGNILADPRGMTLYTLTDPSGKAVDCTGPCLAAWPPLKVADGATEPTGPEGVTLTEVDGPDGTKLVAIDGLPLYTYAGDAGASDANGEGITAFGGTWHAQKTDADVTSGSGGSGGSGDSGETTTTSGYSTY